MTIYERSNYGWPTAKRWCDAWPGYDRGEIWYPTIEAAWDAASMVGEYAQAVRITAGSRIDASAAGYVVAYWSGGVWRRHIGDVVYPAITGTAWLCWWAYHTIRERLYPPPPPSDDND